MEPSGLYGLTGGYHSQAQDAQLRNCRCCC